MSSIIRLLLIKTAKGSDSPCDSKYRRIFPRETSKGKNEMLTEYEKIVPRAHIATNNIKDI